MKAEAEVRSPATPARNLVALFEAKAKERGAAPAVKHKRGGAWVDVSWTEMARRTRDVSDGLAAMGARPGDRIAILGDTHLEWQLADLGALGAGAITVTIYQSNQPAECQYILEDSGARWIFCDSEAQVAKIRQVRAKLPKLEGIFRTSGAAADGFERTLADLERAGAEWRKANPTAHERRLAAIGREAPASFIYTSGTTGNPKGVVLTHGNWVYEAEAIADVDIITPEDVVLLFLPMAHSFAKVIQAAWFSTGASAAFVESLDKIMDNASEVRPTVMPAVPRIFEKAYNTVVSKGLSTPGLKG
jgi:long-chain acyl-CoA synthetase